jgi:hypothetical protein
MRFPRKTTRALLVSSVVGLAPGCAREVVLPPSVLRTADLSVLGVHMVRLPGDDGHLFICGYRRKGEKETVPALARVSGDGTGVWSREYPELSVRAFDWIDLTSDYGLVMVGSTASWADRECDIGVVRMDARGAVLWERKYGGDRSDWASSVLETREGDILVSGGTGSSGAGESDAYVLRLSAAGEVIWSRTHGGEGWEAQDEDGSRAFQTGDGRFVLVSSTGSISLLPKGAALALYLVRIDTDGSKMWERTYSIRGAYEIGTSFQELEDGDFLLAGHRANATDLNGVYLVRTDRKGNPVWDMTVHSFDSDGPVPIESTQGGVLVGNQRSNGAQGTFAHVARIDFSGRKVWELDVGAKGYHRVHAISRAPDGRCAVLCSGPDWEPYLAILASEPAP